MGSDTTRKLVRVEFVCDRCGTKGHGFDQGEATGGFYRVWELPWSKYARPGEGIVCDLCMQSDPQYKADYAQPLRPGG